MAESTFGQWALTTAQTQGSRLSNLTSGQAAGKIKYIVEVSSAPAVRSATQVAAGDGAAGPAGVTGIVFPIGTATQLGGLLGTPFFDDDKPNMIGDPSELNYGLTTGDFFLPAARGVDHPGGAGTSEADGGAQKFINALLDTAYVAYTSGVALGSGLSSMTVSRGNLTLTNSTITGSAAGGPKSGVVNTYSRSYSVSFSYKQSGFVEAGGLVSLPDITDDISPGGDGPF